ncbi:nucleotidyltransferase family protein [Sphaerisporangium sp. B11E5]|uniref:nucleotidyltransferase family protein n=1 Tax=Sphaerisporangium sp. B11E5 TaxID=3153563 RepID=UPI00325C95FC
MTPQNLVLDAICATPLTAAQLDRACTALVSLANRKAEVREILRTHKAFTYFHETLRLLDDACAVEFARAFEADLDERLRHRALLTEELAWLRSSGLAAESRVAIIKGLNNARFYARPEARWSRDVDLFLPTWDDALTLVAALRERGYEFDPAECPWIKAEHRRGRAEYGQLFLVKRAGDRYSRMDLHFGTYSVSQGEYLRPSLTDFYEPAQAGDAVNRLNATGALLVMFAHALSDGYVSLKDANDSVAIATSGQEVDWPRLAHELDRHALRPQAGLLARHLRAAYADVPEVARFAARLDGAARRSRPGLWRMHDRSWKRRAVVNASYTLRAGWRGGRGLGRSLLSAAQCFAFYVRRLRAGIGGRTTRERLLLRFLPKADLLNWRLRPDACPTLIHTGHPVLAGHVTAGAGTAAAGQERLPGVRVAGRRDTPVVVIGDDVFLCTWDQRILPQQVAEVNDLLGVGR